MGELKHTPGPWSVVYYDAGDTDYYDHSGPCPSIQAEASDCAIVHWDGFKQQYWVSANGSQKQIIANATLIAAAPDLLEACRRIKDEKAPAYHDCIDNGEPECAWCAVFNALARATGQSS